MHPSLSTDRLHRAPPLVLMVYLLPINGPKIGPKNSPKVQGSSDPVHILSYAQLVEFHFVIGYQ